MRHASEPSAGWRRLLRVMLVLACALGAFQMAGCVLQRLNTELKQQVDAGMDYALGVERVSPDQRLIAEAATAIDQGDYLEAETKLDAALQINPTSAAAKLNLAAVYEATGRTRRATELYADLVRPSGEAPVAVVGDERLSDSDAARIASFRLEHLRDPRLAQPVRYAPDGEAKGNWSLEAAQAANAAKKAAAAAAEKGEAKAADASAAAPAPAPKPAIQVTLATYKTETAATSGSAELWIRHEALFGDLEPSITQVDLGQGKGKAFRLSTGPFDSARAAFEFCEKLQAEKIYCVIAG